jgi:hypothetical protein
MRKENRRIRPAAPGLPHAAVREQTNEPAPLTLGI